MEVDEEPPGIALFHRQLLQERSANLVELHRGAHGAAQESARDAPRGERKQKIELSAGVNLFSYLTPSSQALLAYVTLIYSAPRLLGRLDAMRHA